MISCKNRMIIFNIRKVTWAAFINIGSGDEFTKKVVNGNVTGWRIWRLSVIRIIN